MKDYYSFLLICCISVSAFGQTLVENKIDEFTNSSIKRTSWERFLRPKNGSAFFRFSKINENTFLDFKYMDGRVFSIDENAQMMIKLEDGTIFTIYNLKYVITTLGGGAIGLIGSEAPGINTSYISDLDPDFNILSEKKISKVRFYTSRGYLENEVRPRDAEKIIKAISLIK